MSLDPRYRSKLWAETYITPANITKDDDSTAASIIHSYTDPPYPISRVFFYPKNVDGIFFYHLGTAEGLPDWKHENYAYDEMVPIELCAVTKQGITGNKLWWKMAQELRSVIDTYPLGSVRGLESSDPVMDKKGAWLIYSNIMRLSYKRAVTDYTSDCTLSYGTTWNWDGDRVDGGTEGQWGDGSTTVDSDGGSTVTQNINTNPGSLTFNLTVFVGDAYSENATNLGISTSVYTKIRFRYKTTGNAKAKIVVGDGAAYSQTVLSETASSTWAVGTVTLTAAKTLDHVALYICDGVGTVQYDYVQVYKADYTFPNVVKLNFRQPCSIPEIGIPSRVPWLSQNTGAPRAPITLTCDLDMQQSETAGATGCWKRTGDSFAGEVFQDVAQSQSSVPWEWLVFGDRSCKVSLDEPEFDYGDTHMLTLTFHEESNIDTSSSTYAERWNI